MTIIITILTSDLFFFSNDLKHILIKHHNGQAIYLNEVAQLQFAASPSVIERDNQQRIVEVKANLVNDDDLVQVMTAIDRSFPLKREKGLKLIVGIHLLKTERGIEFHQQPLIEDIVSLAGLPALQRLRDSPFPPAFKG